MTIKKFIRRNLAEIYLIFLIITMLSVPLACEWRGYFALGGEILILLIPVMLHMWVKIYEED